MAPQDMRHVVDKLLSGGCHNILLGERGTFFGYGRLVNDLRALPQMRGLHVPVLFDATHATQRPGGAGSRSGGERDMALPLASAAVAAGADGVFIETHPQPDEALSDAATMLPLDDVEPLLGRLRGIARAVGKR